MAENFDNCALVGLKKFFLNKGNLFKNVLIKTHSLILFNYINNNFYQNKLMLMPIIVQKIFKTHFLERKREKVLSHAIKLLKVNKLKLFS